MKWLHKSDRPWSRWACAGIAVVVVLLFYKLYAGWYFMEAVRSGKGVFAISPSGTYVRREPVLSLFLNEIITLQRRHAPLSSPLESRVWKIEYAMFTIAPAAFLAALIYLLASRGFGTSCASAEPCRCRRCGYTLFGLSKPQCPECGEPI